MSVSLKHKFTSTQADGTDASLVRPSNWNDEHDLTLAAGKVLGRDTSGAGSAQELPLAFDANGNLGINTSPQTGRSVVIAKNITGATGAYSALISGSIQSDVTANAYLVGTSAITATATFTLTNLVHYLASQSTFGAGSTVTNQYGFFVSSNLVGATNNFGVYSAIPSGANRWNFYAHGTADNFFNGSVGIGTATPSEKLDVVGTVKATTFSGSGANLTDIQALQPSFDLGSASTTNFEITLDLGTA